MIEKHCSTAKAKPIIFCTDMVRAILDGRKTQTRRVIKPRCCNSVFELLGGVLCEAIPLRPPERLENGMTRHKGRQFPKCKPPHQPGDILWVREMWAEREIDGIHRYFYKADLSSCDGHRPPPFYDCPRDERKSAEPCELCEFEDGYIRWRPSIHMPREAARLLLLVTDVRAERLQDITPADCLKEGIAAKYTAPGGLSASVKLVDFRNLWNSLNAKRDGGAYAWERNPWVWVYEFERCEKPEEEGAK